MLSPTVSSPLSLSPCIFKMKMSSELDGAQREEEGKRSCGNMSLYI